MPIAPGRKRIFDRCSKCDKIIKCSTASIVLTASRRLSQIAMTVTKRIVALAVELRVFGIRESNRVQTMGGIEWRSHSKENGSVIPNFREKIFALV